MSMDLSLMLGEPVLWRDVADGVSQANIVVQLDVSPIPDAVRPPPKVAFPAEKNSL
jgi:hypothetical protein